MSFHYVNSFLEKTERACNAVAAYNWPNEGGSLEVEGFIGPAVVSKANTKLNIAFLPEELTAVYDGYERPLNAPVGAVLEVVVWASTDTIDLIDMYRRYAHVVAAECKKEGFHLKDITAVVDGDRASVNHVIVLSFTQVIV